MEAYPLSRRLRPHLLEVLSGDLNEDSVEDLPIEARILARHLVAIAEALRDADIPVDLP